MKKTNTSTHGSGPGRTLFSFVAGLVSLSALAVEPIAIWDGDFETLTQGVTVIELNGNTRAADNKSITIASDATLGVAVNADVWYHAMTIVVKYSGLSLPSSDYGLLATARSNNGNMNNRSGVLLKANGDAYGIFSDEPYTNSKQTNRTYPIRDGAGTFAFYYAVGTPWDPDFKGTFLSARKGAVVDCVHIGPGQASGSDYVRGFAIGGPAVADPKGQDRYRPFPGLVIESVAVFGTALTEDEIAAYRFPSETCTYTATGVSGTQTWTSLPWNHSGYPCDKGHTVIINLAGDTVLNLDDAATNCVKSVTVTGQGRLTLQGALSFTSLDGFVAEVPVEVGDGVVFAEKRFVTRGVMPTDSLAAALADSDRWTGSFVLEGIVETDAAFDFCAYGNASSKVVARGVSCMLPATDVTHDTELVLEDPESGSALSVIGSSDEAAYSVGAISGDGSFVESGSSGHTFRALVSDGFNGTVTVTGMRFVIGDDMDLPSGSITLGAGQTAGVRRKGAWHGAANGIFVNGHLVLEDGSNVRCDIKQPVVVAKDGIVEFRLIDFSCFSPDSGRSYEGISGPGTVLFSDGSKGSAYRTFPNTGSPFVTSLDFKNEMPLILSGSSWNGGIFIRFVGNASLLRTTTIGTLSGCGGFRTDGQGTFDPPSRALKVVQSHNSEWSGIIAGGSDDFRHMEVAAAQGASEKTLTLSGVQVHNNGLLVSEGASAKLTGVWLGDISVAGEFGGSGTNLAGSVTVLSTATLNADWGMLDVESVALPDTFNVTTAGSIHKCDLPLFKVKDVSGLVLPTTVNVTCAEGIVTSSLAVRDGIVYVLRDKLGFMLLLR